MATDEKDRDGKGARGPIIIARHGRPKLDRKAGPRLNWREYVDWWARYEAGGLAPDQSAPAELVELVSDAATVFASQRLRAQETAALAAPGRDQVVEGLFNEAPLPPPRFKRARYLPKTWNVLARAAWLNGHTLDTESITEARARASAAALRLHKEAEKGKVFLAAHGWFNRMLRPELKRLHWRCVEDKGDQYWRHRVYEYRGD